MRKLLLNVSNGMWKRVRILALGNKNFNYITRSYSVEVNDSSDKKIYENRNILDLKERGLIVGTFPDKADEFLKLMSDSQTCYCGFDPTASSLHIGNLLALITLIHCQRKGHSPIALIGSATALIGDPSGKLKERNQLDSTSIISNSTKIQANILKIFQNHEQLIWKRTGKSKLPELQILNNVKWYEDVNVVQFMSSFGKFLRMGDLLSRKHIENRLKSPEGINYTEFSYQVFQAYDWLYLYKNHKCSIQIGGNDQTGNITTGHDLISKLVANKRIFGVTIPIITTDTGKKLGKSEGNAIWLEEEMLSPFEFYQFFYNTSDQMVETYLKIFTFLSLSEIEDLMNKHNLTPHYFLAQKKLASEITLLVHGEKGLESAIKCTQALFLSDRESLATLTVDEVKSIFKGCPTVTLSMDPSMSVLECVMKAKCFNKIEDAARIITSGGFRINHTLITNPEEVLVFGQHILMSNVSILKVGKKKFTIVHWLP